MIVQLHSIKKIFFNFKMIKLNKQELFVVLNKEIIHKKVIEDSKLRLPILFKKFKLNGKRKRKILMI